MQARMANPNFGAAAGSIPSEGADVRESMERESTDKHCIGLYSMVEEQP